MTADDVVQQMPPWECAHAEHELRARRIVNGGLQYRKQCLTCGQSVGDSVSHKLVEVFPPMWDDELHPRWREHQAARSQEMREAQREAERDIWLNEHGRYLLSEQWKGKRRAVLKRDNHTCQGCHAAEATEVHHLSYANHGDELLFQLVSLCGPCHRKVHAEGASV